MSNKYEITVGNHEISFIIDNGYIDITVCDDVKNEKQSQTVYIPLEEFREFIVDNFHEIGFDGSIWTKKELL